MRRITITSALIACLAIAAFASTASASGSATITRSITLKGSVSFPNATGQAVYKAGGGQRELEIELQHIRVLAGKHVNVFVNGNKIASPLVSSLGTIDVKRDTELGQAVPTITSGSTVRVRTLGGTLIAGGTF